MDQKCPIWGVQAHVQPLLDVPEAYEVLSPRAGGRYRITGRTKRSWLPDALKEGNADQQNAFRAKLTTLIINESRFDSVPTIDDKAIASAKIARRLPIGTRLDRLLEQLYRKNSKLGQVVGFSAVDPNSPSGFFTDYEFIGSARAAAECADGPNFTSTGGELHYLMEALQSRDFVDNPIKPTITVAGHARLAELEQIAVDSSQAFVAMWFSDSMTPVYDNGIDPAVRAAGYVPFRVDRKEHNDKIDDEIIAEIRRSRFLIADFTSEPEKPRGGVYFEAGFAKGLNIPVIWMCRKDMIDKVHFDTRQYAHIVWENEVDLEKQLRLRILATIGQGPSYNH